MTETKKYRNFEDFLRKHVYNKDNTSHKITNTRIGNENEKIFGGSYYIPDEEYAVFLDLYVKHLAKDQTEHLTEKQLDKGPILLDLDFRFESSVTKRVFTDDDIYSICDEYLEVLKSIYQFDEDTRFPVFVFQKPNVNILTGKNLTKDGLHIIIGISANRQVQQYLRSKMVAKLAEKVELPIINSWDEVLDEGISKGHTNWQLIGSCKPNHETYKLTHHMTVTYDATDGEIQMADEDVANFNMKKDIALLSARCTKHYDPFIRNEMISEISKMSGGGSRVAVATATKKSASSKGILQVKNRDELAQLYAEFKDSISPIDDYNLLEVIAYTMILPPSYYENGSYDKWVRVGWALHKISDKLFIVWVVFSAQAQNFEFSSIGDMWDRWNKCEDKKLGKNSIFYWAKKDVSPEKFNQAKEESVNYYVEQTLNSSTNTSTTKLAGCTDSDLASVLYQLFKYKYVCVSVKSREWYVFINNRWERNDQGTSLRQEISQTLRRIYKKKLIEMIEFKESIPEDDERRTMIQRKIDKAIMISDKLGNTNDKNNIMTEARELFYDKDFFRNTDTNEWLLCFNNGIWDLKEGVFRDGRPEDYVTKSTNIDYVSIDPVRDATVLAEIADFMKKLFPEPDLEKYMWEHLASVLIGNSVDQTFHNYIGVGENGKSVLVTLLEKCLGEYKGDIPTTMLTDKRAKVGGLTPELVQLKGVRYAVMNEPSKGEKINEGTMKQLTSSLDKIQCRAPFMVEALSYTPQFKLVLLANNLMEIKSQDHGTWRRIRVVDFMSLFTDNPVQGDKDKPYQFKKEPIVEKFDSWKTVFMALLIEKAIKTGGHVEKCQRVLAASDAYRQTQDPISEFIGEKIIIAEGYCLKKTEIQFQFSQWHQTTYGKNGPSAKEVYAVMDKKFTKHEKGGWIGIRIKQEAASNGEDDSVSENDISEPDL
jgi:P4 family phage/plasmid primase-like protien